MPGPHGVAGAAAGPGVEVDPQTLRVRHRGHVGSARSAQAGRPVEQHARGGLRPVEDRRRPAPDRAVGAPREVALGQQHHPAGGTLDQDRVLQDAVVAEELDARRRPRAARSPTAAAAGSTRGCGRSCRRGAGRPSAITRDGSITPARGRPGDGDRDRVLGGRHGDVGRADQGLPADRLEAGRPPSGNGRRRCTGRTRRGRAPARRSRAPTSRRRGRCRRPRCRRRSCDHEGRRTRAEPAGRQDAAGPVGVRPRDQAAGGEADEAVAAHRHGRVGEAGRQHGAWDRLGVRRRSAQRRSGTQGSPRREQAGEDEASRGRIARQPRPSTALRTSTIKSQPDSRRGWCAG